MVAVAPSQTSSASSSKYLVAPGYNVFERERLLLKLRVRHFAPAAKIDIHSAWSASQSSFSASSIKCCASSMEVGFSDWCGLRQPG
jgi:hypothetical protein